MQDEPTPPPPHVRALRSVGYRSIEHVRAFKHILTHYYDEDKYVIREWAFRVAASRMWLIFSENSCRVIAMCTIGKVRL